MFNETITQLTTTTTNHANNFNSINNVLLENDKFLRDQIATKSDSTTVTTLSNKIDVLEGEVRWKPDNWKNEDDLPTSYTQYSSSIFYSTTSFNGVSQVIVRTDCRNQFRIVQWIYGNGITTSYRIGMGDDWSKWQTIATTEKTEILATEATGYIFNNQFSYELNNVIYYSIEVSKADGGNFIPGSLNIVGTVPNGKTPKMNTPLALNGLNTGNFTEVGTGIIESASSRRIMILVTNQCERIRLSGVVVL